MKKVRFDVVEDVLGCGGEKVMGVYVGGWWVGVYVFGKVVVEWWGGMRYGVWFWYDGESMFLS